MGCVPQTAAPWTKPHFISQATILAPCVWHSSPAPGARAHAHHPCAGLGVHHWPARLGLLHNGVATPVRRNVSVFIIEAPSSATIALASGGTLSIGAIGATVLAVLLPLLDGGYKWEAMGMLLFVVLLSGGVLTHGALHATHFMLLTTYELFFSGAVLTHYTIRYHTILHFTTLY